MVTVQDQMTGPPMRQTLEGLLNLATYHHAHEKYYAQDPLQTALALQKAARVLTTLAERWSAVEIDPVPAGPRFAGCPDLNETATIQEHGVLFMEGTGAPSELARLTRDLHTIAHDMEGGGQWLAQTMRTQMEAMRVLLHMPALAAILGERHRIILNDWQAADQWALIAVTLRRALEIVEQVDFTPAALRADLRGERVSPALLYAAAELIDRAADLASASARLIHDNERRWRVFRQAVQRVLATPLVSADGMERAVQSSGADRGEAGGEQSVTGQP